MISIGDFVKHTHKNMQGVVISAKKFNNSPVCKMIYYESFLVYYVLFNSGDIEGPFFQGEISLI